MGAAITLLLLMVLLPTKVHYRYALSKYDLDGFIAKSTAINGYKLTFTKLDGSTSEIAGFTNSTSIADGCTYFYISSIQLYSYWSWFGNNASIVVYISGNILIATNAEGRSRDIIIDDVSKQNEGLYVIQELKFKF